MTTSPQWEAAAPLDADALAHILVTGDHADGGRGSLEIDGGVIELVREGTLVARLTADRRVLLMRADR